MSDKELIKQEIKRRIDLYSIAEKDDSTFARMGELSSLIDFIDSIPEESGCEVNCTTKNEDLEEEINNYIKDNFFGSGSIGFLSNRTKGELDSVDVANIARHFAEWGRNHFEDKSEMVSGDLEEAIGLSFIYHENHGDDFRSDKQIETAYRYGFETGAKWQKKKDLQDFLEKAEKYLVPHIQSILLGDMHDTSMFLQDFKNYMKDEEM